ncbi:hypothetical protein AMATHDRAFT_10231 [Amanita thiersii Skay4041]|uniref:Uncharacterized protein n=1 Tax=Amanita thiersii Skay4041 TaxID=703135 RepID=A0A2A9NBC5_9AGAR|nr:hypothetical protein AMATHDRAFT_10231 [Amanita thiersii Skay4041]
MHLSPFKKVNKTPTNSGTSFFYIVPGYKLTRDEAKKVHSVNFYVKDHTKWVWTKKSSQKPINKKDISRPRSLGQPHSVKAPIYYDNHICLYCEFVNGIKMGNHVYLYHCHLIEENKKRNRQIAQWRAKERASQKEQDEAWNILQRLKTTHKATAYQIETLNQNLEYHPELRKLLLKDPKNHFLTWLQGGAELLQKYRWAISNKERNCLQHSLNGNYIPFERAEVLPLQVQQYLTVNYYNDEFRRIYETCTHLDGYARINFLSIMKHQFFIWILGGEPLLNDFGWQLSAEDRNCFMHALNGNTSHIHEQILFVREYHNAILYIMEHLKDAPQITINSFFESTEN